MADAILDPGRGELVSGRGDLLAAALTPEALAGAVAKQRALRWLMARGLPAMEAGLVPRGTALAPGARNPVMRATRPGERVGLVAATARRDGAGGRVLAAMARCGCSRRRRGRSN